MNKKLEVLLTTTALVSLVIIVSVLSGNNKTVTISLVGDILLDRGVRIKLDENGLDYPYRKLEKILRKSDITFGNLECPLTTGGSPILKDKKLIFKADPPNSGALREAGFDVLNLANNHTMDYGREGLVETLKILNDSGIRTIGAGTNRDEAHKPVYIKRNGIIIGCLGFCAFPSEGYFFLENNPDIAHANENMEQEIRSAKANCDILIVSCHWGREYNFYPSDVQRKLAHTAVDNGADMVWGHHPHVLQGIEKYKSGIIFYSLGNFVFDKQVPEGTDQSIIANLSTRNGKLEEIEMVPVEINNCQPYEITGSKAQELFYRLDKYSEGMNLNIVRKGSRAYIK